MKQETEITAGQEAPVDYQKMYFTLMAAISEATELLTRAQQQCEEWYISAGAAEESER